MAIHTKTLRPRKRFESRLGDEGDPMSSMGNLMDVMLVFACGLLLALIAQYDVELAPSELDVSEVERLDAELERIEEGIANSDSAYAEVGTVYQDVETGEIYVLAPERETGLVSEEGNE